MAVIMKVISSEKINKALADFAGNSSRVFFFALVAGVIMSLLSSLFIFDMFRDVASVYAYYAREISLGNWQAGWVGRVPMLHILLSGMWAKISGLETFRACVMISSLFFVLTIFPLRSFLLRYVSPLWSAWGCVLFIFAPKVIRYSVSGLLDSGRYFFLMASLLCLFRLSDKQFKMRYALLGGVSLAGLSVSRGEGLVAALLMLAGYPVLVLLKQKDDLYSLKYKKILTAWTLCGLFFCIGLLPFCYGNWKYNNCFVPDVRIKELFSSVTELKSDRNAQSLQQQANTRLDAAAVVFAPTPVQSNFAEALKDALRGGYELYLVFAITGMVILCMTKKWNWELILLPCICLLHIIIYSKVVSSYRYSIYLVPLFMPFTITGLNFVGRKISVLFNRQYPHRHSGAIHLFALAVASMLLFQAANGMKCVVERKDKKYYNAAEFIRDYAAKNFPGRRCRVASTQCPKTIYHSGAIAWWGYKQRELCNHDVNAFDLLLIDKKQNHELLDLFENLYEIKTPESLPIRLFRKRYPVQEKSI